MREHAERQSSREAYGRECGKSGTAPRQDVPEMELLCIGAELPLQSPTVGWVGRGEVVPWA